MAAAGGSDRCGEGRTRRRSGFGRSAGTSSGRVTGWGKWPARRRPCPSCAIGNSPLLPALVPLPAGGGDRTVSRESRRGHGGESAAGNPLPSPGQGGERGVRGRGQRLYLSPVGQPGP